MIRRWLVRWLAKDMSRELAHLAKRRDAHLGQLRDELWKGLDHQDGPA